MQRAFIEEQAAQCGYCIPGMMMRAQALLERTPSPVGRRDPRALKPNLCRCGTHMRIMQGGAARGGLMQTADAGGSCQRGRTGDERDRLCRAGASSAAARSSSASRCSPAACWPQAPQEGDGGTPPGMPRQPEQRSAARLPGSGSTPTARITVFTGKAELGQGIRTALLQVAAEELDVDPAAITLVTADTGRTPNEGYTAGSQSMQDSGTAIRHAAAQVREHPESTAASSLGVPADTLTAGGRAPSSRRTAGSVGYGELVADGALHVEAPSRNRC